MSSKLWWVHSPFFSRWSSPVHLFTSFTQFLIFSYSNCHVMQSWPCCPSPPIADHIIKVKRGRLPSEGKTISGKLHQGVKSVCCLSAREADLQYKSIRGRVMDNGASINSPFIRNNTLHLIKRCWRPVDLKYVPCCEASFLWNHRHLKENRRSPSDPGEEDQLPENFFVFIPASSGSGSGLCRLQCHRLDPATQFITRLGAPLHWIQRIVFIFYISWI